MRRIAVFGDIHGNLPALQAVLADMERLPGVDDRYCLGDLVGYAPFPNEVTDLIRTLGVSTIMGNYDDGVGFERDECGCAYKTAAEQKFGDQSLAWTNAHTSDETKSFLRDLLPKIRVEVDGLRILLVHGSPRRLNEYLYEDRQASSFRRLAKLAAADVVVFGHTHIPYVKLVDGVLFVNAGSVGKPKDGDPRACYVLLNEDEGTVSVTFRRVPYDVAKVVDAIRHSELPNVFALQLEQGSGAVTV